MRNRKLIVSVVLLCLLGFGYAEDSEAPEVTEVTEAAVTDAGFNEEDRETLSATEEKFEFQAEVNRLMDIIINSLYSNREIFMRELISNAADACDKIRFQSLTDSDALAGGQEFEIKIKFDKDAKTITVMDTGVGMTKQNLIDNLGVVAKSGTTEFVEAAAKGTDALSLIGQFGVGFYSAYLVADKVTVVSKHNDDDQHIWESSASSEFTVAKDPRGNTLGRGTQVILQLKEDAEEFLNEGELKKIVQKYSQFVNFPISLYTSKTVDKEVPIEEEEVEAEEEEAEEVGEEGEEGEEDDDDEDLEVSEDDEEEEEKPKTKTITETVWNWVRVNDVKAIWTRSPKEIEEEEYQNFFKVLTKKVSDPKTAEEGFLDKVHFVAEGEITFRSILFVPKHPPASMYDSMYEKQTNMKLYVRRVLISDQFDDFLPRYMNFVFGVLDSDDLPLNVARETLAQSRVLKVMSKKIVRKVLEMLRKMAEREEPDEEEDEDEEEETEKEEEEEEDEKSMDYDTFWKSYGKSMKLGILDDRKNKNKLSKLLRYVTSKSDGKHVSLESYVDRMQDDQKSIYYITGESLAKVKASPFIERLAKKDLEVIYMIDPLDEYVVQSMTEFDGVSLQSVTKEGLKLGDEDKKSLKELKKEFKPLTDWMKGVYGETVDKVVVSNRISKSPCVLVTGQYGWSANMERIMKAQTLSDRKDSSFMAPKKTLEINPQHPILLELQKRTADDEDDQEMKDLTLLMYDSALLASGFTVDDPTEFSKRVYQVVNKNLDLDPDVAAPEWVEEEPADEEEEDDDDDDEEEEAEDSKDEEEVEEEAEEETEETAEAADEAAPAHEEL